MKITGICFTRSGMELAQKIHSWFLSENGNPGGLAPTVAPKVVYEDTWFCKGKAFREQTPDGFTFVEEGCTPWAGKYFSESDAMIFIGATGICVRAIAPYVKDKKTDPAVIVFDEKGTFGISLLSGHIGGANALTEKLCKVLGSVPVVTTATDVNRKFAVDVYATENNLAIGSMSGAKDVAAALVDGEEVAFSSDTKIQRMGKLPGGLKLCEVSGAWQTAEASDGREDLDEQAGESNDYADKLPRIGIHVSPYTDHRPYQETLQLIPRCMTIGIGCRRDTPVEKIEALVDRVLEENHIHPAALSAVATIDLKKDEKGLLEFCRRRNLPFIVYTADELKVVEGDFSASGFVSSITGVDNVCERAAVKKGGGKLIIKKTKGDSSTCAVTLQDWRIKL